MSLRRNARFELRQNGSLAASEEGRDESACRRERQPQRGHRAIPRFVNEVSED